MPDRTENVIIQLDNGQQLLIKPHHTPQQILKGVKILDAEGSYPTFLKRYGELENKKAKRPNKATAIADSAIQGLSFGFADEAVAGLNAGIGKLKGEGDFGDLYDQYHSTYQADLDESSELLSTPVRVLAEYGIPIVIARSIISKVGSKIWNGTINKLGKSELRKEAKQAGLTKKEIKEWEKINELPKTTKSKVLGAVQGLGNTAITTGSTVAAIPTAGAIVGAGSADRGERVEGLLSGAVVGANVVNKINPLAQGFKPKDIIGELTPGFNQGGLLKRGLL